MRTMALILIVLLVGLGDSLSAQLPDDTPFAEFDFDDGRIPDRLAATQGWAIVEEGLIVGLGSHSTEFEMVSIPDGVKWTNYAVEARVKVTGGTFSLDTRLLKTFCGGYSATFMADEKSLVLFSVDNRCNFTHLETAAFTFPMNTWTTIRLELAGPEITVLVDDEAILSATDDASTQGFLMVTAYPDAEMIIDDLKVRALEAAPREH